MKLQQGGRSRGRGRGRGRGWPGAVRGGWGWGWGRDRSRPGAARCGGAGAGVGAGRRSEPPGGAAEALPARVRPGPRPESGWTAPARTRFLFLWELELHFSSAAHRREHRSPRQAAPPSAPLALAQLPFAAPRLGTATVPWADLEGMPPIRRTLSGRSWRRQPGCLAKIMP